MARVIEFCIALLWLFFENVRLARICVTENPRFLKVQTNKAKLPQNYKSRNLNRHSPLSSKNVVHLRYRPTPFNHNNGRWSEEEKNKNSDGISAFNYYKTNKMGGPPFFPFSVLFIVPKHICQVIGYHNGYFPFIRRSKQDGK